MIPKAKKNELTGILGREVFEAPPGDVESREDLARWYAFRAAYRGASNLVAPVEFPLQVDFELTSTCNFRCAFCPHGQETPIPKRILPWSYFEAAIREGEAYGLVSTKLNYINEPLLHPEWDGYVRFAKAHGVLNVYFATNGSLLTARNREKLISSRVSKVMVSLDATTAETFRKVRRSDAFDRIVANIEALLELRDRWNVSWPKVRVNFLKTELNAHEADAFVARWNGVADAIGFQDQVGLPGVDEDVFAPPDVVDHSEFRCAFPSKMLVVDAAGHILPCCTFSGREMPIGRLDIACWTRPWIDSPVGDPVDEPVDEPRLAPMSLAAAWNSSMLRALRREHFEGRWRENDVCRRCVTGVA